MYGYHSQSWVVYCMVLPTLRTWYVSTPRTRLRQRLRSLKGSPVPKAGREAIEAQFHSCSCLDGSQSHGLLENLISMIFPAVKLHFYRRCTIISCGVCRQEKLHPSKVRNHLWRLRRAKFSGQHLGEKPMASPAHIEIAGSCGCGDSPKKRQRKTSSKSMGFSAIPAIPMLTLW